VPKKRPRPPNRLTISVDKLYTQSVLTEFGPELMLGADYS
jgi:hypothetical protein